ncbi:MAG TPA: prenyltransferase/squalene oxidase repeat-containing protein [Planctomycetota bacterium]|nr:prenyltransferase/squalene oxidase repeat-containing protein [Planctomycetota bacterium]
MNSFFLESLDRTLREGLALMSGDFAWQHARFVLGRQSSDGGFRGRQGGPDLYYTDFALRVLSLAGLAAGTGDRIGRWLQKSRRAPRDVVECFSQLNLVRLLEQSGITVAVDELRLPPFEFTAYNCFLAALCCEMLEIPFPERERAIASTASLARPGGGYANESGASAAQTNATAAAVAFLALMGAAERVDAPETAGFLASMQASSGGLKAHAAAEDADLLSTFTGLVAISTLDSIGKIDLPAISRFLRDMAVPCGGFRACHGDAEPDVEYTYYGLATAAMLRNHVAARKTEKK